MNEMKQYRHNKNTPRRQLSKELWKLKSTHKTYGIQTSNV
jgi:hypothetical protein